MADRKASCLRNLTPSGVGLTRPDIPNCPDNAVQPAPAVAPQSLDWVAMADRKASRLRIPTPFLSAIASDQSDPEATAEGVGPTRPDTLTQPDSTPQPANCPSDA